MMRRHDNVRTSQRIVRATKKLPVESYMENKIYILFSFVTMSFFFIVLSRMRVLVPAPAKYTAFWHMREKFMGEIRGCRLHASPCVEILG